MVRRLRRTLIPLLLLVALLGVSAGSALAGTVTLRWEPTAARWWAVDGHAVESLFDNGQCTQWAIERRPGIVRRAMEATISREIAHHRIEDPGNWDARYWPSHARAAGIPTGHRPKAHSLIVFQPGVLGAGTAGHIAYVQRVFANGSFSISEMHAPALGQVSYQHLTAADGRLPGVTFIY